MGLLVRGAEDCLRPQGEVPLEGEVGERAREARSGSSRDFFFCLRERWGCGEGDGEEGDCGRDFDDLCDVVGIPEGREAELPIVVLRGGGGDGGRR